jgi:hypothetical protein
VEITIASGLRVFDTDDIGPVVRWKIEVAEQVIETTGSPSSR